MIDRTLLAFTPKQARLDLALDRIRSAFPALNEFHGYAHGVSMIDIRMVVEAYDRLRSDLAAARMVGDEEVEESLHDLESWGAAYPTDIFPEPTKEQIEAMVAVTAPADGVSRVAAANARHLYKVRGPKLTALIRRLSASLRAAVAERDRARAALARMKPALRTCYDFIKAEYGSDEAIAQDGHPIERGRARFVWEVICKAYTDDAPNNEGAAGIAPRSHILSEASTLTAPADGKEPNR